MYKFTDLSDVFSTDRVKLYYTLLYTRINLSLKSCNGLDSSHSSRRRAPITAQDKFPKDLKQTTH